MSGSISPAASGSTLGFGNVVMPKKPSLTFNMRNTGTGNLTGMAVSVSGPNAADFKITANLSAPLKPAKSKTFKVQFVPGSPGSKQATLHITSNDPNQNPYLLNLTATAVARKNLATVQKSGRPDASLPPPVAAGEGAPTTSPATSRMAALDPAPRSAPASSAAAPWRVDLAGTSWFLPARSVASLAGAGTEIGQGRLRLTFDADGGLDLEDDNGTGFRGTYAYDGETGLSAQVFPQSVEDYVRAAYGSAPGFGVTVDAVDLNLQVANGPGGPMMNVTLDFTASLTGHDPDARQTVTRELTYDVNAEGPQD